MALASGGLLKAIASMKPYPDDQDQDGQDGDAGSPVPASPDLSLHQLPLPTLQDPAAETTDPQSATPTSQPKQPDIPLDAPIAPPTSTSVPLNLHNPMSEEIPGGLGTPGNLNLGLLHRGMLDQSPVIPTSPTPVAPAATSVVPPTALPPKVTLPPMSSMPSSARVGTLQGQLDQVMNPQLSLKDRLLKTALRVAPAAVAMAFGGRGARMGAAEGLEGGYQNDQTLRQQKIHDLQQEVAAAEHNQEQEYGTQTRAAEIEAQAENNRILREMMVTGQNQRATDKNNTTLTTHGYDPKTGQPSAPLAASNQAKLDLMEAQTALAAARAKGEPDKIRIAEENLGLAKRRVAQGDQHLALDLDKFDYQQYKDLNPDLPTQTTKTKIQQASAIHDVGDKLMAKIDQYRNLIGPTSGRWTDFKTFMGDQSPEAQDLRANIASYAALHPALHGFRGQSAYQHFFDAMGGKFATNADAMKAGVKSLTDSADTASGAWKKGANPANLPARRTKPVNPGTGQPKVGDTKKFPNGNIGVWDGQGWAAQSATGH